MFVYVILILYIADGYVPVPWSLITEDGKAVGASLQKIWKSHCIPISTKIRLMKSLVWPMKAEYSERMKKHVFTP